MSISNTTPANSAAIEARETPAQTKAEATKGDQQAIRKLVSQQATQAASNVPVASPAAAIVDSDKGTLDAKA
jgi:hypothetical protein